MSPEIVSILAGFMAPIEIHTDWRSMLWMFPLLASIAIIYKATKMRVLFWKRFVREVVVLFLTVSLFMIAVGIVLNLIVHRL
ncbi:MAG: hypothetical protein JXA82_08580 [Sedimentisphaerales bacterium]|nr:hypothetical protein [Sedimentisphaerales bacterium]